MWGMSYLSDIVRLCNATLAPSAYFVHLAYKSCWLWYIMLMEECCIYQVFCAGFSELYLLNWKLEKSLKFHEQKKACRDGTPKTSQTRWEWPHDTFSPSLHHFANSTLYLLCAKEECKAVSGVGGAECVVHNYVDMHKEWVVLWVAAAELLLSMADMANMVCLIIMQKNV